MTYKKCAYENMPINGPCEGPVTHEIKKYFTGPGLAGKSLYLCTDHAKVFRELHPFSPAPTALKPKVM